MDIFVVEVHYIGGQMDLWNTCDSDKWSYFEILDLLKKDYEYSEVENM